MATIRVSNVEAKADAGSPTIDERVTFKRSTGENGVVIDSKQVGITSVGINTDNPKTHLEIVSDDITQTSITSLGDDSAIRTTRLDFNFSDGGGAAISAKRAAGVANTETYLSIRTGGSTNDDEKVRITADGYVGINTNTPGSELDVNFNSVSGLSTTLDTEYQIADIRVPVQPNDTIDTHIRLGSRRIVDGGSTSSQAETYIRGSRGGIAFDRGAGGASPSIAVDLTYSTDNFAASRVTAFRVNDDGTMESFGPITNNATRASGENGYSLGVGGVHVLTRNAGSSSAILDVYGSVGRFRVMGDGDCQNTNNNYGSISDVKLKENIVDANSQWDDLKAIRFRKYNFKAEAGLPTHTQLGVVAQELEQVCPGLVEDSYEDEEGVGESTKTVSYSILLMKAAVALQEAQSRIEALEQRLDAAGL